MMAASQILDMAWSISGLGEAIEAVARRSGVTLDSAQVPAPRENVEAADADTIHRYVTIAAQRYGLEAEAVETSYAQIDHMLRSACPSLLQLPPTFSPDGPRFVVLLENRWGQVTLLVPDLSTRKVPLQVLHDVICHPLEAPLSEHIDEMLRTAGVPEDRRNRARTTILRERLRPAQIGGCWMLRLSPKASIWNQLRQGRMYRPLLVLVGAHLVYQILLILSWWLIAKGALADRFESAWLIAWALVLFTIIPFQLLMTWSQSTFSVSTAGIFKQRLLYGALQLEPEEIRHEGAGQFLGRVMESDAIEAMALGGGFSAIVALVDLILAAYILSQGAGGWPHALLLLGWVLFTILLGWRYFRYALPWVDTYRKMTNDLVERMVGHRTRLAQEDRTHWHDKEDVILASYLILSQKLDRVGSQMTNFVPRGWLALGLLGVVYAFVFTPNATTLLAISIGGIALAFQALSSLMGGMANVIGVILSWDQVAPLFKAAKRSDDSQPAITDLPAVSLDDGDKSDRPILIARDIVFRYRDFGRPILKGCDLQVSQGDRLLLEGPSGGGKSTLAAVLVGLRQPESGLLLLRGFDRQTLGTAEWRRRVISAPQFHENHVFTETFAFNLLMGRRWPPQATDLEEAEVICRELGLGDVLDRMPAGLQQMVGESGWQLSHGERSRLYIARALLQNADLIVLDESFAALDPKNLSHALQCVLNRASTLMVIAHP